MDRQGAVSPDAAAQVAGRLLELGCYEVSMGDTIGVGTPASVSAMFQVCTPTAAVRLFALLPWAQPSFARQGWAGFNAVIAYCITCLVDWLYIHS